jgi:hypothetical protein
MDLRSDHEVATDRMTWERFLACEVDDQGSFEGPRRWPDEVRQPTWAMKRSLLREEPLPPQWQLVRALDVQEDCVDDDMFARWLQRGALRQITTLRLLGAGLTGDSIVRAIEEVDGLRILEISGGAWNADLRSLRGRSPHASLVRFAAHGCRGEVVACILEHAMSASLKELAVSHIDGESRWWDGGALRQLEELTVDGFRGNAEDMSSLAGALPGSLRALSIRTGGRASDVLPLLQREIVSLQSLDLSRNGLADSALVSAPLVRGGSLKRLSLAHNPLRGRVLRALGEQLAALEVLDLAGTHVGDASLASLPGEATLQVLDLSRSECTADGVCNLLRAHGATLKRIAVAGLAFDAGAVARLGGEIPLPTLEALDVSGCPIASSGLVHLLVDADLPQLRILVANGTPVSGCVFETASRRRRLESLWLDRSRFGAEDADALFDAENLPRLCSLQLGTNHLSLAAASALATFASQGSLTHVTLDESVMLGAEPIAQIVAACAPGMVELKVGQSFSSAQPLVRALAKAALHHVRRLDLLGVILDADGLRSIVANPTLEALESLSVQVEDEAAVAAIARSSLLGQLRAITVHGGAVEQEAMIQAAQPRAPWLEVMVIPSP